MRIPPKNKKKLSNKFGLGLSEIELFVVVAANFFFIQIFYTDK